MVDVSTGSALRATRMSYHMTQAQLGRLCDVKQPQIYVWESRASLPWAVQERLRRAFATLPRQELAATAELDKAFAAVTTALEDLHAVALKFVENAVAVPMPDAASAPAISAPSGRNYVRQTPTDAATLKLERQEELIRAKWRLEITKVHRKLKPLAAAQDWDAYGSVIGNASMDADSDALLNYLVEAKARVIADDDPLVTLPPGYDIPPRPK